MLSAIWSDINLNNFLESGFKFTKEESELKLRYMLFNILLAFNAIIVFLAAVLRVSNGEVSQGIFDISYSFLAIITIFLVRKYRNLFEILIKFTMVFSLIIVSFIFSMELNSIVGVSWFIIQLMVVFFLTDRKFSYFIFASILAVITYITYINEEQIVNISSVIFAFIPIIVAFVFIQFYEKRNTLNHTLLKEQNDRLKTYSLELKELANKLEIAVEEEVNKNKVKDELLAKQSKLAALAEMMDAIAHQWKQPLGIIQLHVQSLTLGLEYNVVATSEDIEQVYKKVEHQVSHLTTTIDEFRNFFRPNSKQTRCNIKEMINSTLVLIKDCLIENKIEIEISTNDEIEILCNPSEFKHVFINLINNAKDAFEENNIQDKRLCFEILNKDNEILINF